MSKPRIHILALGGTIATRPDASGVMQMGLGADDLVLAVPLLAKLAEIEAETYRGSAAIRSPSTRSMRWPPGSGH
jgi:L-asparaginase/Glu-tRNA(Gln) amidotransferase subunit D